MSVKIIGIGGIGKGIIFESDSNETLGRNESRLMRLLPSRDYCKLHIVFHYIAKFASTQCKVIPIGFIGNDNNGNELLTLMQDAGMCTDWIERSLNFSTMLSVCFQYPDKSGGNITSCNSACSILRETDIKSKCRAIGITDMDYVVALPEVPVSSRLELLKEGHDAGAFCITSFSSEEAVIFDQKDIMNKCNLIALNQEETRRFASINDISNLDDAQKAADIIIKKYPHLKLWLTVGSKGSISADKDNIRRYLPLPVKVINTGGAGDATLGGIIAGLASGLPFHRKAICDEWEKSDISSAAELGALLGGLSVESEDSIDSRLDLSYVKMYVEKQNWKCSFDLLNG